jgi:hypothetical protein
MHVSKWEYSTQTKICKGCDKEMKPYTHHLHAKFSIETLDPAIHRMITIRLCQKCISQFETYAKSPSEIADETL